MHAPGVHSNIPYIRTAQKKKDGTDGAQSQEQYSQCPEKTAAEHVFHACGSAGDRFKTEREQSDKQEDRNDEPHNAIPCKPVQKRMMIDAPRNMGRSRTELAAAVRTGISCRHIQFTFLTIPA